MLTKEPKDTSILIVGDRKEAVSLLICLLKAGHKATLVTTDIDLALKNANVHIADLSNHYKLPYDLHADIKDSIKTVNNPSLAIIITDEDITLKKEAVNNLQAIYKEEIQILVNAESIALSEIQVNSNYPQNIMIQVMVKNLNLKQSIDFYRTKVFLNCLNLEHLNS